MIRFEKQRNLKLEIKNAIKKFNFKPKNGIKILISLGVIEENNAASLAKFI